MPTLTPAQLYDLARSAGLTPGAAVVAAAVALAESGGRTDAVGDTALQDSKWGPSIGLWQVRSLKAEYGTGSARDASRLTDPAHNARAMAEISGAGANWRPWSVYTSGAYRDKLPAVVAATGQVGKESRTDVGNDESLADRVGDGLAQVNPLAVFEGWQDDLRGALLTLVGVGAALTLVVLGVKSAAGSS